MVQLPEVGAIVVGFGVLGALEARVDSRLVDIGPARQQCVLAVLLVAANTWVPTTQLVERVWGEDTPHTAASTLRTYISRLRGVLKPVEDVTIVGRTGGYTLRVDPLTVDLHRFEQVMSRARAASEDDGDALALWDEALRLWRGEAFAGLDTPWLNDLRDMLAQQRRATELDRTDLLLRHGQHSELLAGLSASAAAHPLDERLAGQLILALYRNGRQADALDHYQRLRGRLAEELGTDPSPPLQYLHQRILTADPTLTVSPAAARTPTPRQLPAAPRLFTGRKDELAQLTTRMDTSGNHGDVVVISAIGGTGGIGKTWLAVRWAHQNIHRFPDGQLFTDLHGFSPTEQPAHPTDVLGGFLHALGVDRDHQPNNPDHRAELYRSLVADKQMLIVLDNAATTHQVTPLLPGGGHCTVIVTSRNQLHGLLARHGAHPLHLDILTDPEAHTLLTTGIGPDRVTADPPAITKLVDLCGGFPLALGVVAARATANARLPLADIVTELRTRGLDALDSDDPTASLPTVLSWSLDHLTDHHRQVFALLGAAPGPDTGLPAATALTGLSERETYAAMEALADATLINRTPGSRYHMHDLVRTYATQLANTLPADARETALRRVLDFYTQTAHAADRLLDPHIDSVRLDLPAPGSHSHPLSGTAAALAWFDAEHTCLLAAQHIATAHHWHAATWWLAWGMHTFHHWQGHRHDQLATWQAATDAATHLTDPTAPIFAHRYLGLAHAELGQTEDAINHLNHALTLAQHHHNPAHQAHIHIALTWAYAERDGDQFALDHSRRALDLLRGLDHPVGQARALNAVGWFTAHLGDYDTAREHCQAALTLYRHHHNPIGKAATLDSLGYIDHHTGHHHQAINHYHHALTLYRDLGNTYETAGTLAALGHPYAALGHTEQARTAWREALQLYQEQDRHEDAAQVQHQLDTLETRQRLPDTTQSGTNQRTTHPETTPADAQPKNVNTLHGLSRCPATDSTSSKSRRDSERPSTPGSSPVSKTRPPLL